MADWAESLWRECIGESFDEHGISATEDQIAKVAADAQGMHDNWDLCQHTPSGPSPETKELAEVKKRLADEQRKVTCRQCRGTGEERSYGPVHMSISECWKCRGQGRHAP